MKITAEINEQELKELVRKHLVEKLGDVNIKADDIEIEVKSKQNYRSEWESAAFRARIEKSGA